MSRPNFMSSRHSNLLILEAETNAEVIQILVQFGLTSGTAMSASTAKFQIFLNPKLPIKELESSC